jgi:hypothetical protein
MSLFNKEVFKTEINGYEIEIEELDILEAADYTKNMLEMSSIRDEIAQCFDEDKDSGKAVCRDEAGVIKLTGEAREGICHVLAIPVIRVNSQALEKEDIPMFVKKIGEIEATKLCFEIDGIGAIGKE